VSEPTNRSKLPACVHTLSCYVATDGSVHHGIGCPDSLDVLSEPTNTLVTSKGHGRYSDLTVTYKGVVYAAKWDNWRGDFVSKWVAA